VIRQAYKSAGSLDTALTGYFECHGTGTPVGDPIEVSAVGNVFSKIRGNAVDLLPIGSVKTNLGHSESASGIAGIMKAVLALEKGVIPPTIGLVNPNPNIDFEGAGVYVVTEATNWPKRRNGYRRVSVNSFGYG
jgi:acyl transferase domain-containing protein